MADNSPRLSVVIVAHDSRPALEASLGPLSTALKALEYELILIDNASRDGSADLVGSVFASARVERSERNLGFAAACNRGAALATGDWLLFVNPDVTVDPDAVRALLDVASARPDGGLISGRLRWPDGSFQPTCRRFPTVMNMVLSRRSFAVRLFGPALDRGEYTLPDCSEVTVVPAVAATFVMIARHRFDKAGGFDERFFMYMEDTDLSLRLHQAGFANLFVPQAGAVHDWGHGSSAGRITRLRRHHVAVWKYFLKNFPNGFSVMLLPGLLLLNFVLSVLTPQRKEKGAR